MSIDSECQVTWHKINEKSSDIQDLCQRAEYSRIYVKQHSTNEIEGMEQSNDQNHMKLLITKIEKEREAADATQEQPYKW